MDHGQSNQFNGWVREKKLEDTPHYGDSGKIRSEHYVGKGCART